MVPLHYDLGPSNVMVDIIQNKMTGIIDFTGCKMGDNHFDLARVTEFECYVFKNISVGKFYELVTIIMQQN